ncbi:MAG: 30S ribosomal protein S1 [Desulfobulbaceae bacterium]|jgi:small subunit ribosomal protein S1|nr:30S ribosomal protein S1 [Desulfobulbaceae bacterium]
MEEALSFAELLKSEDNKKIRRVKPGQKLTATVVGFSGEAVFLDVGAKSEGVIDAAELRDENGEMTVAIGDSVAVYALAARAGAQPFTTRIGGRGSAHLEEAFENGIPVEGVVKAEIKGGFEIALGAVRAFCPYSQIGLRRLADPTAYIGQTLSFRISRYGENGRNIVLSARALQEEEQAARREDLRRNLKEGDTVEGEVSSIRDFGVFVDLGGTDGLIPLSEMSWNRGDTPNDIFHIGQKARVLVKKLDWDNGKISLSYKETLADPWQEAAARLTIGETLTGTVARLTPFGAFVTLMPGVDGLVHISKLGAGKKIHHPREALEEGQQIEVTIEEIQPQERRVSLAPSGYVSPEKKEEEGREEFRQFQRQSRKEAASQIGGFGALLQAKLAEKQGKTGKRR